MEFDTNRATACMSVWFENAAKTTKFLVLPFIYCCPGVILAGNAWGRHFHCWKAVGTHRNAVPAVKCFRTHYGRHCEPFSGQKCTRLQDFCTYSLKVFPGNIYLWTRAEAPWCWDLYDTDFRLARQRSHCSCFTKWPLFPGNIYLWTRAEAPWCSVA